MTSAIDYSTFLEPAQEIAIEAGRRILDVYDQDFDVSDKEDGSPLTEADEKSHAVIVRRLTELTPDIPVLSEESEYVDYNKRKNWNQFWLVDPLDGTKEFVKRNGEFTVNIALIDGRRSVLGVVYVPVTGLCYSACHGQSAFRKEGACAAEEIHVRQYEGGKPVVVASRSHASDQLQAYLDKIGDYDIVSMGSSLKFCLVAQGSADIYPRLGPTSEWDTAAAQCVVELAGGHVTDPEGNPLSYNKSNILNPHFLVFGAGDQNWRQYLNKTSH